MSKQTVFSMRLKELRELRGFERPELASIAGFSAETIARYERGEREPKASDIQALARILNTTAAYLMGETNDPAPKENVIALPTQSARLDTAPKMPIPVISMRTPACAGAGNGLDCLELEAEETYHIDRDAFSVYDEFHRPFGVYVEGDSMEEQGINDGDIAIINPAEPILSGDIVLVSYMGQWSIKGLEKLLDGSIRLRAGKLQYERIVPAEIVDDENVFRIIGKVVFAQTPRKRPKRFV